MNIPDAEVYSALPVIAGGLLWTAKAFVTDIIDRTKRRTTTTTTVTSAPAPPPTASTHVELTLGDFRQIAELLKAELNGRYMFAAEARQKFDELGAKLDSRIEAMEKLLDSKVEEIKVCLLALSRDPHAKTRCTD